MKPIEKFDFVLSNPPYQQKNNTDNKFRSVSLWHNFLQQSLYISKNVSMINPARWMKGGSQTGLMILRRNIVSNKSLCNVTLFEDSTNVFPTVSIAGGISIETFKNTNNNISKFTIEEIAEQTTKEITCLKNSQLDIIISEKDEKIINKIFNYLKVDPVEKFLWLAGRNIYTKEFRSDKQTTYSTSLYNNDYSLDTQRIYQDKELFKDEKINNNYVKITYLRSNNDPLKNKENIFGIKYFDINSLKQDKINIDRIKNYQVAFPKTDGNTLYRRLMPIAKPYETYSFSWISRSFETLSEAQNFENYMKTYFYRYLIGLRVISQDAYANIHRFVPDLASIKHPITEKTGYINNWTDEDLKILFKNILNNEEWEHITKTAISNDKKIIKNTII